MIQDLLNNCVQKIVNQRLKITIHDLTGAIAATHVLYFRGANIYEDRWANFLAYYKEGKKFVPYEFAIFEKENILQLATEGYAKDNVGCEYKLLSQLKKQVKEK